jgi:hypothetical protein
MKLLIPIAAAVALVLVPSAAAKGENSAVVIGPGKIALVEPYDGVVAKALDRLSPAAAFPSEPYALVYVVRRWNPQEPARWFPGSGVLCDARSRCADAPELRGWFGSGRLTGLYTGEPLRIVKLTKNGRTLPVNGVAAHAIELGFGQASSSARQAPPRNCFPFEARWAGSYASSRPTAFCIGLNGGLYAKGRAYPFFSRFAERLTP